MSLGRNIRRLRLEAGFRTQKEFASHLGVPQPQASDWENDRYGVLETMTILRIAKFLGCSLDQLLAGVDPAYDGMREMHEEMPVVAEGEAFPEGGRACDHESAEPVQRLSRPGDLRDPRVYGVRILGESMLPTYRPGVVAIAAPHCPARDGDEVYAHLVSGERLVRVVHAVARGFVLQPYNSAYAARFVAKTQVKAIHAIVYRHSPGGLGTRVEPAAGLAALASG